LILIYSWEQIEQAVDKVKAQIPKAGKAEDGKKNS
jgi:hypothetical protein